MDTPATPFESLTDALQVCGSQAALARVCGVSQPAVWKWLQSGKHLPAEHVLTVEQATGVSKHLLRPDIYPPEAGVPPCSAPSVAGGVPIVAYDRDVVSDKGAA